ncbi:MAG: hypothetical protein V4714_16970 [Bacteroidota bacterium]
MKFGFAQEFSYDIKSEGFQSLSEELTLFLADKDYGKDLKELYIGIICVHPDFDQFYKPRRPRYTSEKKRYEKHGVVYELDKTLGYDIILDHTLILKSTQEEHRKITAQEILNSLIVFDKYKAKIKDFDREAFKADLEGFFRERHLLTNWS